MQNPLSNMYLLEVGMTKSSRKEILFRLSTRSRGHQYPHQIRNKFIIRKNNVSQSDSRIMRFESVSPIEEIKLFLQFLR